MTSKTPQFDAAIEKILDTLVPHERMCKQCGAAFQILAGDIEFYKMFRVPPPTLCWRCRMQRRIGQRISIRQIFYKRSCAAPGHNESIITFYDPGNPVPVYDDKYYASDAWDGVSFGSSYDAAQNFFTQFRTFALRVPHQSLQRDLTSVNCEYTISGALSKNCYYVAVPLRSENIYCSGLAVESRESIDVTYVHKVERCYECGWSDELYNCNFCYQSSGCINSNFLFDCRNCSDCFGCTNLRNKQYYFLNEPLTKAAYEERVRGVNLGKRSVVREYEKQFAELVRGAIHKSVDNVGSSNVIGDALHNCKDAFYAFTSIGGAERVRYVYSVDKVTDICDVFGTTTSSRLYESTGILSASDIKFSLMIRGGMGLEYSMECTNCDYCFGCFGLKSKKYHIYNQPYGEKEYWQRVDELKTAMLAQGVYGEFFPLQSSEVPYNDSNAMPEFPIAKDEAMRNGWWWHDAEARETARVAGGIDARALPDDIADVSDDITTKVVYCEKTGKPFRITPFELQFYRAKRLPLPAVHPFERNEARYAKFRRPQDLWDDTCAKCGKRMLTVYDPSKKLRVYCESCYNAEVI